MDRLDHQSVDYRKKALPLGLVRRILRRQQQRIFAQFCEVVRPTAAMRVLDLGVNGSLDRPEDYFFEFHYPYREQVLAAGLEEPHAFRACFAEVPYVQVRRGAPLPFPENAFDVVFCNAVIEHVGSRDNQRQFLQEILRVGQSAFVTTPNRWYPVDLHTILPLVHWLPPSVYRPIYRWLGFDFFSREENLNLLDRGAFKSILPPSVTAQFFAHRFLALTSNWVVWIRKA